MGCGSSVDIPKGMPLDKPRFYYYKGYGRGEPIRMMLSNSGVDFVDHTIEFKDWPNVKKELGIPQIPCLEIISGEYLTETNALYKLVARKYGYWPSDIKVAFEVDWITEEANEVFIKSLKAIGAVSDPYKTAEDHAREFKDQTLPNFLRKVQPYCKKGTWMIGDKMTLPDFLCGHLYLNLLTNKDFPLQMGEIVK